MSYVVSIDRPDTVLYPRFKVYTQRQIEQILPFRKLPETLQFETKVVSNILPFRVNQYVIDELINWDNPENDPLFTLTFPQRGMIPPAAFDQMAALIAKNPGHAEIEQLAKQLRKGLNPHPSGQMELNIPELGHHKLAGMQHKYRETLLFFPIQGQVCHSYCTFCFRWAQFVGDKSLRFASNEVEILYNYLSRHREITDLLITGGDPMVMKTRHLVHYLNRITETGFDHVQNLRFGTKALTYWPQRFISDADADDLLRIFEKLIEAGKHVSIMAHINHWRELDPVMTQRAILRIKNTGAEIRAQGPLLAKINDDPVVWTKMWHEQVKLGIIPYYMFVERDTGAQRFFEVPLVNAWQIYRDAIKNVSGLARTVRGPSMSSGPGKIEIQGITEINGQKLFVLRFIQGRNENWVQRPFFAEYDPEATWLTDLQPAFNQGKFFFEDEYLQILTENNALNLIPN
ncbi:MAG: KamA family radical SAM protein [Gammaproteobacteria bacterium]